MSKISNCEVISYQWISNQCLTELGLLITGSLMTDYFGRSTLE